MLEFEPEGIGELTRRLPKALEKLWDIQEMEKGNISERPGLLRENVFDFFDGVRLIISKDKLEGIIKLHISGSLTNSGGVQFVKICNGEVTNGKIMKYFMEHIIKLRGKQFEKPVEVFNTTRCYHFLSEEL